MTLFEECLEALEEYKIIYKPEADAILSNLHWDFFGRLELTEYSSWREINDEEADYQINQLGLTSFIVFDDGDLPIVKTQISRIMNNWDDIEVVSANIWLVSEDLKTIIEFYHDGSILLIKNSSLSRNELIDLTRKLCLSDGTEEELKKYFQILDLNVPYPNVLELIYPSDNNKTFTPEEIVETALSYDWRKNQNIIFNNSMIELISCSVSSRQDIVFSELLKRISELYMRLPQTMNGILSPKQIASKNKIKLDFCETAVDMVNCCVKIENFIKEKYPNRIFQSYFEFRNNVGLFTFHAMLANCDYIPNEKIVELAYPIRKNTF